MKNKAAAVLVVACVAGWISPRAFAQLLPPLPTGSLVVTMTSPASGSTVSGTVPVSASVSIVGALTVAGVQFKLDGANLGAEDTSAPYSVSWNTAGVGNGTHTLTAVARAALLGLTFTSNSVTVTVNNAPPPDTTPPTASLTAPANGATVSGTVAVSASASDNVGVAGVQFQLDGANLDAEDTSAPYSVSWNTGTVANGMHTLTATARDPAGNHTTSVARTVTVNNAPPPDTTPPTVSLTAPANGATVSGTVAVSASASDNVGVAGVQFQLDGANLGAEDASAPYSVSWNTGTVANGTHTLTATARDAATNRTTSTAVTVTVNNAPPPDTTAPTVSLTAPANGATVSGTVAVSASASDNVGVAGVQFQLDGANLGAEDTVAPYSISWNTTGVANGAHTLRATARDAATNRTTSTAVTVTVNNAPPPDTTPPTVNITAPANGATVSGTVTVSANASDNVGVAGVQFLRDGVAFGAEDTSAPYSIVFDTTAVGNGQHTLAAVARDAAGNRTTSATVTVTVANAAATRRFEETDPAIAYTSGWASDSQGGLSGGTAAFTNGAGAQATFTFTGTSVSWIGGRSFETGIAQVFLDGSLVSTVDTYSKTVEVQVPIFTATGLANASHTLAIQATGQQNAAAVSAFIILDAFDVPAATISRLQDTDPTVSYTGTWIHGDTSDRWSGGSASASVTAGDQATFTFTGTGVRWLGARGAQHGIARVSLDGAFVTQVDTFQAPTDPNHPQQVQAELFKATGLANGPHTLTIQVTGQNNLASTNAIIVVDAFDVITPGTRHEDTDAAISYTGAWARGNIDHPYSAGSASLSTAAGDQATFSFTGTSVSWIGWRGQQGGMARVFLDGALAADNVNTFVPTPAEGTQNVIFTTSGLTPSAHTLTIQATGPGVVVDAFDVAP